MFIKKAYSMLFTSYTCYIGFCEANCYVNLLHMSRSRKIEKITLDILIKIRANCCLIFNLYSHSQF